MSSSSSSHRGSQSVSAPSRLLDCWQVTPPPARAPTNTQSSQQTDQREHNTLCRLSWGSSAGLGCSEVTRDGPDFSRLDWLNCQLCKAESQREVREVLILQNTTQPSARLTEKACRRSCGGGFWTNHSPGRPEIQGGVTASWPIRVEILTAETSGKNSDYNLTRRVELLSWETKRIRSAATYNKEERRINKKY